MSNLKTLKDFEYGMTINCKEELKAEAIKWVKEDTEEGDKNNAADLIIKWMKRFDLIIDEASNLTEEDLNDKT